MAESHIKAPKGLEPSIERLVAGSSATFELSYFGFIMCIRCTGGILSTVSIVTNGLLSGRDLVFEAFVAEDSDVVISSREGAIHPNKCTVVPKSQARSLDQLD